LPQQQLLPVCTLSVLLCDAALPSARLAVSATLKLHATPDQPVRHTQAQ
jgi:hypothetical protein